MPATDPQLLERVRERCRTNNYWRHMGVEAEAAAEGWVRLRVPLRPELRNADGAPVHGGVISFLVDAAIGGALSTMHEFAAGGVGQATLDLNVTFMAAARGEAIAAEGTILRRGGTIAFGEAQIFDDADTLVAKGRATYIILSPTTGRSEGRS